MHLGFCAPCFSMVKMLWNQVPITYSLIRRSTTCNIYMAEAWSGRWIARLEPFTLGYSVALLVPYPA